MKTQGRTKSWVLGALALLGTMLAGNAKAATMDSLTVTITPNAFYAVDVDTAISPALLNLGTVDLGLSTFTVNVTTVEVQSSQSLTDLSIQAQVISGGWTIDGSTAAQETDSIQAWAVFTDTSIVSATVVQGLAGAYDAQDVLQTTPQNVGNFSGGPDRHMLNVGAAGYKAMEDLPSSLAGGASIPASRSHLWLKFTLPLVASLTGAQQIYVTVTAGAPN